MILRSLNRHSNHIDSVSLCVDLRFLCVKNALLFLLILSLTQCRKVTINGYDKAVVFKETIADSNFLRSVPVNGTSYPFPKTNAGYEEAGTNLKNPLLKTNENLDKGKEVYTANCKHCHGQNGRSDAPMIIRKVFPPPPNYTERIKTITEGKMYHSLYYGKNLMPSFKNDLSSTEKWQVIFYVQKLAGK